MKGSDGAFITKVAVVMGKCPVPYCPEMGGDHKTLPRACLDWWREEGSKTLGWRGIDGSTSAKAINEKLSNLKKNHKKRGKGDKYRDWQELRHSQRANSEQMIGSERDKRTEEDHPPRTCEWCQTEEPLSLHLKDAKTCLQNYRSKYLPYHGGLYAGNERLATLDLGLVLEFCINPTCTTKLVNLREHLRGPCASYYEREGRTVLSSWKESNGVNDTYIKLRNRRTYVKTLLEAHQGRLQIFTSALDEMLTIVCTGCRLQGPFLDRADHKMECLGTVAGENGVQPIWQCGECRRTQKKDVEVWAAKLQEVGSPEQETDDTLKPVKVDTAGGGSRVVYAPSSLVPNLPYVNTILPQSTTVLVPKYPEAVQEIGEEAFLGAAERKATLKDLTNFLSRRPSPTSLDVTLSVAYKKKLSDIREERLKLMNSMSTSKGEIISRAPKQANIVDRKAHFDATLQQCLTNTCSWSEGARQQRREESLARSHVNGQVKTSVSLILLKSVAVDNHPLVKVIESTYVANGVLPILSLAPIVLRHVEGKLELLKKHVISCIYNNWDLDVEFLRDEWTVVLKGFLYSEEYENLNRKIARQEATSDDLLNAIIANPHIFPTVSLNAQTIADLYGMNLERAQVHSL